MKNILKLLAVILTIVAFTGPADAQFTPGQILSAAQLNSALAGKANVTGGTSQLQYLQGATGSVARSITNKLQDTIAVKDFGPTANGSTDDFAVVQAAINATPANGVLYLGPFLYAISAPFSTPNPITIIGSNGGGGEYSGTCVNGLRTTTANMNLFPSLKAGSTIRDVCIDTTQTNTSGAAFTTAAAAHSVTIEHNQINGQCIGVSVTGSGSTQTKNAIVAGNVFRPANNSACAAIVIGQNSTGANTGDGYYRDNTIFCNNAAVGMYLYDSGGDMVTNNNIFACSYGTLIKPGASQQVLFAYFTSTILGDYSSIDDLLIDTASSSAGISSLFFTQTWTSGDGLTTATGPNVLIQNTGVATNFQGIKFLGHRSYSYVAANDNFKISGANVKFVEVQNSHVCAAVTGSGGAAGIHITSGPAYTRLQGNLVGSCDVGGSFPDGILVDSGANLFTITGNDVSSGTTAWTILLSGLTSSTTAMVKDNLGVDNNITSITSAATIGIFAGQLYSITGTTAVTTINGMFSGRVVYLTTPSGVAFNTGGNICNAVTSAAGNTVIGYWTGSCWQLK